MAARRLTNAKRAPGSQSLERGLVTEADIDRALIRVLRTRFKLGFFDPDDRNIMYAESQGGDLVRIQLDTGLRKHIHPSPKEGQPRFRFNWNTPFVVSPHNSTTLYVGGNYVFKLTDRGETWACIGNNLPPVHSVRFA